MLRQSFFSALLLLACFVSYSSGFCTPKPAGFQWKRCPKVKDQKILVKNVRAMQDGKDITAVDMDKPLTLVFSFENKYGRPIQRNRFSISVYSYIDSGDGCSWEEQPTGPRLKSVDACTLITPRKDCRYPNNLSKATYVIDFHKTFGEELTSMTVPGTYYLFEISQFDGDTQLNCISLQNRLTGTPPPDL